MSSASLREKWVPIKCCNEILGLQGQEKVIVNGSSVGKLQLCEIFPNLVFDFGNKTAVLF